MKASAILTADIEIRSFQPVCRTDNHWKAQERKIKWLCDLQKENDNCPIFDAGDLLDKKYKTNPSHELLNWAIHNLPYDIYTVPGNHDLPGKSIKNYKNSAMAVLEGAGVLTAVGTTFLDDFAIIGFPWGVPIKLSNRQSQYINKKKKPIIALIHEMIYENEPPFPGCEGFSAEQVIDMLPGVDLIVTGHHHQTFTLKKGKQILVNPGSLMRNDADQVDFKPSVFLWYAENNSIKRVFVPIEEGVISREHIEVVKQREERLDAFIEKLGDQTVTGVNFHENLERAVSSKEVAQPVKDKVWQYYEGI